MRALRVANSARRVGPTVAVATLVAAALTSPLGSAASATVTRTTVPRATLHCGAVTFEFSPDNSVTYFRVDAIGVSCATAKIVLTKGGKYHGVPPVGWKDLNSGVQGTSNCFISFAHGSERVIAYRVNNGEGC